MESEYQVLNHLQENEKTSQRAIAEQTGLSLGAVNILIKKMARKGLIKVEQLNSRTMRYILTPQGMQEKARLTYCYIRQSYRQILTINETLDQLLKEHERDLDGQTVILMGPSDEISEILTQRLKEHARIYQYLKVTDSGCELSDLPASNLIIVWREEEEEALFPKPNVVNIMKLL